MTTIVSCDGPPRNRETCRAPESLSSRRHVEQPLSSTLGRGRTPHFQHGSGCIDYLYIEYPNSFMHADSVTFFTFTEVKI
jgi:hypothetical protein